MSLADDLRAVADAWDQNPLTGEDCDRQARTLIAEAIPPSTRVNGAPARDVWLQWYEQLKAREAR